MILVTGATGFIGTEVVRRLSDEGIRYKCLVRTPGMENKIQSFNPQIHYGDLLNPNNLRFIFKDVDTIVNVAGTLPFGDTSEGYRRKNVGSAVNLVEAAEQSGVKKIVHVSAVGSSEDNTNPFLRSKYLSENVITRSAINTIVLRLPHVFGANDSFTNYCAALMKISPFRLLYGDPENILQPIHVSDVANCIVQSSVRDDKVGATFDLVGPESISYMDLFTAVKNRFPANKLPFNPVIEVPEIVSKIFSSLWSSYSPLSFSFGQYMSSNMTSTEMLIEDLFGFKPKFLFNNIQHVQRITYKRALMVLFGEKP